MFPTARNPSLTPRLSPSHQKAADRLGLTVTDITQLRVVIRCPFCPGVRTIHPNLLPHWAKKGRVPSCEAVKKFNRGTECRQPGPTPGVADGAA